MTSSITLSAFVCAVLMCTSMAAPTTPRENKPSSSSTAVTPLEEAQHIALDADVGDGLLPDPELVKKIMAQVAAIRTQQPAIAKVRNNGRWILGYVKIDNLTPKMQEEIKKSDFGPVKREIKLKSDVTIVGFGKPYNPDILADKLHAKFGVVARGVWKDNQHDFGAIKYSQEDSTYTFRQGLENCRPNCQSNHSWVYKIDANNKSTLDREYATDIPERHIVFN